MIDTSSEPSLVERLQANAMDSLVHGVEHHIHGTREYDHKYVILHVFHAVELFLKARLAKHKESLIYKKNGTTIGADHTIDRLIREAHIDLSKYVEDRDPKKYPGEKQLGGNLKKLKEARHNIEHKEIGNSQDDIKIILGEVFNFLDGFVGKELGLNLKNELDKLDSIRNDEFSEIGADIDEDEIESTYRTLSMSYVFYHRHMMEQGIINYKFREHDLFTCEECGEESVAFPDPTLDLSEISNYKLAHCRVLEVWENQNNWIRTLPTQEREDLHNADYLNDSCQCGFEREETIEPPEYLEYQQLQQNSYPGSMKDRLLFMMDRNLRQEAESYIHDRAIITGYKSLNLPNLKRATEFTVANLYWYFKDKERGVSEIDSQPQFY